MDKEFSNLAAYSKSGNSRKMTAKTRAFLYVFGFIIVISGAIFAGNYFLSQRQEKESVTVAATPTPTLTPEDQPTPTITPSETTPTPSKTPTSTPAPTGATLRIEVLNGSGTSGVASKMASYLKSKGYSISATANADSFDYTQTVIQIKKSKNSYLAQLKKDLSASYTVDPTVETLAESSAADAIVIVGEE